MISYFTQALRIVKHSFAQITILVLSLLSCAELSAQSQSYTTPGTYTFTVPAGVTSLRISVWGGGGAGGGAHSQNGAKAGGGGEGGSFVRGVYTVTPGTSYTVVVGAGGTGALAQVELQVRHQVLVALEGRTIFLPLEVLVAYWEIMEEMILVLAVPALILVISSAVLLKLRFMEEMGEMPPIFP